MIRTIQCSLPFDEDLENTILQYNKVVQDPIDFGWKEHTYSKSRQHKSLYYIIREKYPQLQSSLIQCARDMACAILKRDKFKHKNPQKKKLSGIRYNQRTFSPFLESQQISICTIKGRKRYDLIIPEYFKQYLNGEERITSMTLRIRNKDRINIYLQVEIPDVPIKESKTFLGVDRGIKRVAVCSNNKFYDTKHILALKWRFQQFRNNLQSKGTRSAKRKLKKLAGRERRFMTDENRKIALWIVKQPYDCIVLENLKGLKQYSKKRVNKALRRKFSNWSYYQLEKFIIEKCEKMGKTVLFVNPRYTSQRCSRCGYISKLNRKDQSTFCCVDCGFELNADLNASRNLSIYGKTVYGRVDVNHYNKGIRNSLNVTEIPMTNSIESIGKL
jgi:IS605 OrfB family transposase